MTYTEKDLFIGMRTKDVSGNWRSIIRKIDFDNDIICETLTKDGETKDEELPISTFLDSLNDDGWLVYEEEEVGIDYEIY